MDIVTSLCQAKGFKLHSFPTKITQSIPTFTHNFTCQRTTICFCVHLCTPNNSLLPSQISIVHIMSIQTLQSARKLHKGPFSYFHQSYQDSWTCEGLRFLHRSVLVIISAMKSMCGVLFWNCTAIKNTFHREMKRNGRNSDCKGEVMSRNTLCIPYSAKFSQVFNFANFANFQLFAKVFQRKFLTCSVRVQQAHKIISTKSSKIAIHKNLDPQKFSTIRYAFPISTMLYYLWCNILLITNQVITMKAIKRQKQVYCKSTSEVNIQMINPNFCQSKILSHIISPDNK